MFTRFAGLGKKLEPVDVIQVPSSTIIELPFSVWNGGGVCGAFLRGERIWPQGMHLAGRCCLQSRSSVGRQHGPVSSFVVKDTITQLMMQCLGST